MLWAAAFLAAAVSTAASAAADEIRAYDGATCAQKTVRAFEVGDENWVEIRFRPAAGKPWDKIETRLVLDIKRGESDPQVAAFRAAEADLGRGNFASARQGFATVAGGGWVKNPENDTFAFKPFPKEEAGAKAKWYAIYAQFFFAKAAFGEGKAKGDKALVGHALRALEADAPNEKGFLPRTKEGKSRWYADALHLRADCLLELGRYADAATAFDELFQKSIQNPAIGSKWTFLAKIGPGRIAEAQGDGRKAEQEFAAAASALQGAMNTAPDACARRDLGRYFSEARMRAARMILQSAEVANSAAEYDRLRNYLVNNLTPDALRGQLSGQPAPVVESILEGALSPSVQAVVSNGNGMSQLFQKKWVDALFAFNEVRVKHYAVREEVPRALYYLAKAADGAAKEATKPDAKALFTGQAAAARAELERSWKGSPWATKK
jgi:tetratricopeptide (TPR) repeat protein